MTPELNTPQHIMHEVPDNACESSKQLAGIFDTLREEVLKTRWEGITVDDIILNYNKNSGKTEVIVTHGDANGHLHRFMMQLIPDTELEETHDDNFLLTYSFKSNFNENDPKTRSFVSYLSEYLSFNGLELSQTLHPYIEKNIDDKHIVRYTEDINIHCDIEDAYKSFCTLLDITLSKLKPMSWFYTPEPTLKGLDEAYYYMNNVCSLLQIQSSRGRWKGVTPGCFKVVRDDGEVSCELVFQVKDVWELCLLVNIADCEDYNDKSCIFYCIPNDELSDSIKNKLHSLFGEFINTLNCAKEDIYVGAGKVEEYFMQMQNLYIEDTFDVFCSVLDEIVPKVQSYNFQIPDELAELTEEIAPIRTKMEMALSSQLDVSPETEEINKKLRNGFFKVY